MKSIPLFGMVAQPSPDVSFLIENRRPWIMGVLNATPDSFYAESRTPRIEQALERADEMVRSGADVLDVGGESTRPGAGELLVDVELERVLGLVGALHLRHPAMPISVDTQKAAVARQSLAQGATLINDISALRNDPGMKEVLADSGCPVVLMHMQGTSRTMQDDPRYSDVVADVKRFLEERMAFAIRHGIREERLILDPGIGFGKTVSHNMTLLHRLGDFLSLGRPLLIGVSRKSFIGHYLGGKESPLPPEGRLEGSLAAALWAVQAGIRGLRVHDVGPTRRALQLWEGIGLAS